MPLVRIDTSDEWSAEQATLIGDTVYAVLHQVFSVPENDKFQVIQRHSAGGLNVAPSFFNIEYSSRMVIIQITLNQGRSTELKQRFYAALADALHAAVGIRREDVMVSLVEVVKENWSFGCGIAQFAEK